MSERTVEQIMTRIEDVFGVLLTDKLARPPSPHRPAAAAAAAATAAAAAASRAASSQPFGGRPPPQAEQAEITMGIEVFLADASISCLLTRDS